MTTTVDAPPCTDGVVTLRPYRADDVDEMLVMCRDPGAVRWTTVPAPYERHHGERWITEPGAGRAMLASWAIEALDDDGASRFAGNVDLIGRRPVEIGFLVAPWARGRGLAARATRLATGWAFTEGGQSVVHWRALAGNFASWRVAHACGFTFQAELPLAVDHRGELCDLWHASLRPGDPREPRTTWWSTPVLDGPRVRLRPLVDADVPRIVEACRDPRSRRYLRALPDPYTEDTARAYVRSGEFEASRGQRVAWAVADHDDDRLLGNISVFDLADPFNPTGGEIGYWAHPDARGRGVTGEALELVARHAFTPAADGGMGRHRLRLGAAWSNAASRHVAEQAGFTLVGHHHADCALGDGELDDSAWYERLRTAGR